MAKNVFKLPWQYTFCHMLPTSRCGSKAVFWVLFAIDIFGSDSLAESYKRLQQYVIHSFPAWHSALKEHCGIQAGKFRCSILGQGT